MDRNTITILLLKEEYNKTNAFKDLNSKEYEGKTIDEYLKAKGIGKLEIEDKFLYYRKSKMTFPKWDSFFNQALSKAEEKEKENFKSGGQLSGLFFIEIESSEEPGSKRTFALTFGSGRYFLEPESIETKFGLLTTLSIVDPQAIKSAGINTIDAVPLVSRTQAIKGIGLNGIGFDTDTDVLKSIRGLISGEDIDIFGNNLQGADSLQITTKESYDTIQKSLVRIYQEYKSDKYKEKFKEFLNIFYIEDQKLKKELDAELVSILQSEESTRIDKIWIDIPEIIDSDIIYFGLSKNGDEFYSLDLEFILKELKRKSITINLEDLQKRQIFGFNDHGNIRKQWSIYQCLIAEIDYDGKKYALGDRDWYVINEDYLTRVNEFYDELSVSKIEFIPNEDSLLEQYKRENPKTAGKERQMKEAAYNYCFQKKDSENRILCDAKNIPVSSHSSVEFCDIYTKDQKLIHIKRYKGQSAPLSHLFAQGKVSAQLLKNEKKFRKDVNDRLLKDSDFTKLTYDRIDSSCFEIVFGIIQSKNDYVVDKKTKERRPKIPFFSKINLMKTVGDLRSMQYKVSIAWIPDETSENPAKTEKEKKDEKKKLKAEAKATSKEKSDKSEKNNRKKSKSPTP